MRRYTHQFTITLIQEIDSDIKNFDAALDAYIAGFLHDFQARAALLSGDEYTDTLRDYIRHTMTIDNAKED